MLNIKAQFCNTNCGQMCYTLCIYNVTQLPQQRVFKTKDKIIHTRGALQFSAELGKKIGSLMIMHTSLEFCTTAPSLASA